MKAQENETKKRREYARLRWKAFDSQLILTWNFSYLRETLFPFVKAHICSCQRVLCPSIYCAVRKYYFDYVCASSFHLNCTKMEWTNERVERSAYSPGTAYIKYHSIQHLFNKSKRRLFRSIRKLQRLNQLNGDKNVFIRKLALKRFETSSQWKSVNDEQKCQRNLGPILNYDVILIHHFVQVKWNINLWMIHISFMIFYVKCFAPIINWMEFM